MIDVLEAINMLILAAKSDGYDIEEISDTFHTFGELYDHRTILLLALLRKEDTSWFSMKHSDGSMFDGMFIAGYETEDGPITYHIEGKYLPLFKKYIKEIPNAPEWDGHTPNDVLYRITGNEDRKELEAILGVKYNE